MKSLILFFICVFSLDCLAVPDASQKAFLRIEVGQHTAMVNKLSMDGAGSLLATASDDKTVRLWNLPDGSPYAILRVPIGDGKKGELYAVALSPDAKTVATAGETGDSKEGFSLYLFDVEKRALKGRISGLPSPILHLAYSKDGKRIAAAFSGGYGIKLWDAQTGSLVASDDGYQERSTWLDFDPKGNLATVSYDGVVRVYDPALKLLKQARPRAKARPYSIAYSSNGSLLAVGYADFPDVDILNANDLKTVKTLQAKGLSGKNLAVVAWQKSAAGEDRVLAAGDMKNSAGKYVLRLWSGLASATPSATDIAVADNIVTDIATLENDKADILFASADPSWGAVKNTSLVYKNKAQLWDARVAELDNKSLRVSADGLVVEYPADLASNRRLVFDMGKMKLELREQGDAEGLSTPLTGLKPNKITQWRRNQPSFNGHPLDLDDHELSYALAIDKATGNFLLGTEYKLRWYDNKGKEIKSIELPAPAYGVNLSGNGKLAVAALGDGTLRWYSLGSGEALEELATLFPYNQGKEWIVWTKEGFFGNSDSGGDNLAGYHIDKGGSKRPEWMGFSQLYQAYYAPELLADKLLRNEAPIKARLASMDKATERLEKLPVPIIELTDYCLAKGGAAGLDCKPIAGQGSTRGFTRKTQASTPAIYRNQLDRHEDRVKLRYKVTAREGGIGNIDVYVNGKIQQSQTPPASAQSQGKAVLNLDSDVLLADGENQILIQAYEKTGGAAEKSMLVALLNPAPGASPSRGQDLPKLIVAAVGIDRYAPPNELKFAVKDAMDFLATVEKNKSDVYGKVVKFGVFNEKATAANINGLFADIEKAAAPDDTVLVYLSGHGLREGMDYYFIPYDVDASNIAGTALSQQRMKENIAKLAKVSKVFLFIDSCHSGAFELEGIRQEITSFDKLKHQLGESIFILAASRADQEALDQFAKAENGLFAYAVLEGLNGSARRVDDNVVDNYNLGTYVQRRIDALSRQQTLHKQQARFQQAVDSSNIQPFDITKVANVK